jgi:hypothetical protein
MFHSYISIKFPLYEHVSFRISLSSFRCTSTFHFVYLYQVSVVRACFISYISIKFPLYEHVSFRTSLSSFRCTSMFHFVYLYQVSSSNILLNSNNFIINKLKYLYITNKVKKSWWIVRLVNNIQLSTVIFCSCSSCCWVLAPRKVGCVSDVSEELNPSSGLNSDRWTVRSYSDQKLIRPWGLANQRREMRRDRAKPRDVIRFQSLYKYSFLNSIHFSPDDGGSMFLWNVGNRLLLHVSSTINTLNLITDTCFDKGTSS